MSKEPKKEKIEEINMPLSIYIDKISQDAMNVINQSNLDIYLKYIVAERIYNAVSEALQNQRMQYQEKLKKDGDADGNSKTK